MRKIQVVLSATILAFLVLGMLYLALLSSTQDYCVEQGSGETIIQGRVYDYLTKQPLDSIQLALRTGASGDMILDTVLSNYNGIDFVYNVSGALECELVWMDIYRKGYDLEYISRVDEYVDLSFRKGGLNTLDLFLHPLVSLDLAINSIDGARTNNRVELAVWTSTDTLRVGYDSTDFIRYGHRGIYYEDEDLAIRNDSLKKYRYDYSIKADDSIIVIYEVFEAVNRVKRIEKVFHASPFDTLNVSIEM